MKDGNEENRLKVLGWAIQRESSEHAAIVVKGDLKKVVVLQVGLHVCLALIYASSHTPLVVSVMRRFLVWPARVTCLGLHVARYGGGLADCRVVQIQELQCFVIIAATITDRLLFWQLPCCSDKRNCSCHTRHIAPLSFQIVYST